MVKRSLKASTTGIDKAKKAFERKGWTQEYLAAEVGLSTRQSVWKFFTGKAIDRNIFIDLCFQLDIDWQEIADLPNLTSEVSTSLLLTANPEINDLVNRVRSLLREQIQVQCGLLKSCFDVTQPLQLESIYTEIDLLSQPNNQRWLEVDDLQLSGTKFERVNLDRSDRLTKSALDFVSNHTKLVLLGKPGAGKTTFLQHLAFQCNKSNFQSDRIPVFIPLRTFAIQAREINNFSFVSYIIRHWQSYGITDEQIEILLRQGKILLLLDGLDEISDRDNDEILKQIQQFAEIYYQNQIIVTCRLAAQQYHFHGFTYVELADFNEHQIETFVRKWFIATARHSQTEGIQKADRFLEQLKRQENQPIRELVATPILLSLICSVFQEKSVFPTKRFKLYQEGLDILLVRWDRARGIQRDRTYQSLSLSDKIKLLSQIAATTFYRGNYFFEKSEVLSIIADYLVTLPDANTDPETLWLDSEAVLKAIEVQHGLLVEKARGIYSFSHLTFQEYLTARKIVASPNNAILEQSLQLLTAHTCEAQWREVILLTAGMLPSADRLLLQMKQQIDALVISEKKIRQILNSIEQKISAIDFPYRIEAVRAFYLGLYKNRDLNLAVSIDNKMSNNLSTELSLDLVLTRALELGLTLTEAPELKQILNFSFAMDFERSYQLKPELAGEIKHLKELLPEPAEGKEALQIWWQSNGQNWVANFRKVIIARRCIGYEWDFNKKQQELFCKYYSANQFLVECLNSDFEVTIDTKKAIETTILQVKEVIEPI
jgi:predicted NACHT family NTPase